MQMGLSEIFGNVFRGSGPPKGEKANCPNCGEAITLEMERCPKCGVRIKSMFRRKCPKCGALNELDIKKCSKCFYDFEAELQMLKKTYFVCPFCGYKSDAFMTECYACGAKFV
jgi:predicted RNA-binding Zn-ribbon protein involved in translation (DUF1610 family)